MTDDTPWLDDEQAEAWLALVSILEVLPATLDAQLLRDADLTFFEFLVLIQLAEVPGHSLRLSDLASATNTTLPRLSRVVGRLEDDGLVLRQTSATDGRSRLAHLTDAGWRRLDEAATGHVGLVHKVFTSHLSRAQLDQLRRIGGRLLAGLDPRSEILAQTRASTTGRPGLSRAPLPPD